MIYGDQNYSPKGMVAFQKRRREQLYIGSLPARGATSILGKYARTIKQVGDDKVRRAMQEAKREAAKWTKGTAPYAGDDRDK